MNRGDDCGLEGALKAEGLVHVVVLPLFRASSGGATVCSPGREPLGRRRASSPEPQRGDRSLAHTTILSPLRGSPLRGTYYQGLVRPWLHTSAPLGLERHAFGWSGTSGVLRGPGAFLRAEARDMPFGSASPAPGTGCTRVVRTCLRHTGHDLGGAYLLPERPGRYNNALARTPTPSRGLGGLWPMSLMLTGPPLRRRPWRPAGRSMPDKRH